MMHPGCIGKIAIGADICLLQFTLIRFEFSSPAPMDMLQINRML